MNDSTRRAIRTALQSIAGALGAGVLNLVFTGINPGWLAVAAVVLTTVFTQIQNALEDRGTIPALLKAPASDGVDPVPNNEPLPEDVAAAKPKRKPRKKTTP